MADRTPYSKPRKCKCRFCNEFFDPDPRNHRRQIACLKPTCQKARKAFSQKCWLSKPENQDHFRGQAQVQRVQEWRKQNPEYWKKNRGSRPKSFRTLQDLLTLQVSDCKVVKQKLLQDLIISQHAVVVGLISNITGSTLQDSIFFSYRRLNLVGEQIIKQNRNPTNSQTNHDHKKDLSSSPVAQGP